MRFRPLALVLFFVVSAVANGTEPMPSASAAKAALELNDEQKEYNRGLSSFRVAVEHRIGRTKRFRIVSDRFRNPRRTHHTKTSIIAGLVNVEAGFMQF